MGDVFCAWPQSAHRHPELSRKTSATGVVRASWGVRAKGRMAASAKNFSGMEWAHQMK